LVINHPSKLTGYLSSAIKTSYPVFSCQRANLWVIDPNLSVLSRALRLASSPKKNLYFKELSKP